MKVRSTLHDSFEEYPENLALCSVSLWPFSLEPHKGRFLAVTIAQPFMVWMNPRRCRKHNFSMLICALGYS